MPRPMAEYQAAPGLSFHALKDFEKSPDYYYRKHVMRTVPDRDSEAFALGRALHCLVLEGPETYALRYVTAPPDHLTASGALSTCKATREWINARQDVEVLSPGDAYLVQRMADRVRQHPHAAELLVTGEPEVEQFSTYGAIPVKGRADWWCDRRALVVDLKTTKSMDTFREDAFRYGYDQQLAWYTALFGARDHALIVAETCEPLRVRVYRFSSIALGEAKLRNGRALAAFEECQDAGTWPIDRADIVTLYPPIP